MIDDHPLYTGAVNDNIACPLDPVATTLVGAFAIPIGTTLFDQVLGVPTPIPLTAVTVKTYEIPLVSHVIVIGLHVHVNEISPVDDVTT